MQLGTVPVLLIGLGPARFGQWSLLLAGPAYLALADIGLASAVSTECTRLWAQGATQRAARLFADSTAILLMLTSLAGATLFGVLMAIPGVLNGLRLPDHRGTFVALAALLVYTAGALVTQALEGAYRFTGRFPVGVAVTSVLRLTDFLGVAAAALAWHSLAAMALSLAVLRWSGVAMGFLLLHRIERRLWANWRWPRFQYVSGLWRPSAGFVALPLGNLLTNQGLLIVTGHALGPIAVAKLSVARTIANVIRQCSNGVQYGVLPQLTRNLAVDDTAAAAALLAKASRLLLLLTGMASLGIALGGPLAVGVWTGHRLTLGRGELVALVTTVLLDVPWQIWFLVAIAENRHARLAFVSLGASALSLLAAIFLVPSLHLYGVALSLTILDAILYFPMYRHARGRLGPKGVRV